MSESSSSSSSSSSGYPGPYSTIPSTPFFIQMPNANSVPTNAEIQAVLPGAVVNPVGDPPKEVEAHGFLWSVAGHIVNHIEIWILKRAGWLLIDIEIE